MEGRKQVIITYYRETVGRWSSDVKLLNHYEQQ